MVGGAAGEGAIKGQPGPAGRWVGVMGAFGQASFYFGFKEGAIYPINHQVSLLQMDFPDFEVTF